ncbi:MAG TPA: dienelactone hydrolase family protein [Candidatus Nitrosotalea sp.]|nr:dienelactone hydrolase family protein [Candidatus Nitrosotalea sp.]
MTLLVVLASSSAAEQVIFESPTTPPVELTGLLYRPDGPGPFPAMVLLHGCSGIVRTEFGWAGEFQKMGYAALIVDSFRPRGHSEICTDFRRVTRRERVLDAYAALRWLRTQAFIDGRRIGVAGWSNGGFTVLQVMDAARERPAEGFRAAVAVYPECRFDRTTRFYAPLLILIGGRDDWTEAATCQALVADPGSRSAPLLLHVYPDAYHSFDNPSAGRQYLPGVENGNKPGGGATIAYDPAARADAIIRVTAFLHEHLTVE